MWSRKQRSEGRVAISNEYLEKTSQSNYPLLTNLQMAELMQMLFLLLLLWLQLFSYFSPFCIVFINIGMHNDLAKAFTFFASHIRMHCIHLHHPQHHCPDPSWQANNH